VRGGLAPRALAFQPKRLIEQGALVDSQGGQPQRAGTAFAIPAQTHNLILTSEDGLEELAQEPV
jgi:hypothetical protein